MNRQIFASIVAFFLLPSLVQQVAANPVAAEAQLQPGAPFADNDVLQRPLPVWGWGQPGSEALVEFAGQKESATVAQNGKWSLALDPLEASAEPRPMRISVKGGESRTINNLLVGVVWIASGQSNMQWIAAMIEHDPRADFGPELSVLANSLSRDFGGKARCLYTIPSKDLAPEITAPAAIKGSHRALEVSDWTCLDSVLNSLESSAK